LFFSTKIIKNVAKTNASLHNKLSTAVKNVGIAIARIIDGMNVKRYPNRNVRVRVFWSGSVSAPHFLLRMIIEKIIGR